MNGKKSVVSPGPREPLNLIREMTMELDRMFDEPWTLCRHPPAHVARAKTPICAPKVDVVTNENKLVIRVGLPGLEKDEVEVKVEDGFLIVSCERKKEPL